MITLSDVAAHAHVASITINNNNYHALEDVALHFNLPPLLDIDQKFIPLKFIGKKKEV